MSKIAILLDKEIFILFLIKNLIVIEYNISMMDFDSQAFNPLSFLSSSCGV